MVTRAPYGSWTSPIGSEQVVAGAVALGHTALDGDAVYWVETRPAEDGRCAIVRRGKDGVTRDVLPAPWNARTRVHEYGGAPFAVADGVVFFSNFADQRLYRLDPGHAPRPLADAAERRYADAVVDARRKRLVAVCEDHTGGGNEPVNRLVGVGLEGEAEPEALASGYDFYAAPRLRGDGKALAWLCWNHPNMPWDGSELFVGELDARGRISRARRVAGGANESIFQPEWSPAGVLHFVSDRSGYWNLYRLDAAQARPLCPMEAEFGLPQWAFGMSTYALVSEREIVCAYTRDGLWQLARAAADRDELDPIETPWTEITGLRASNGRVIFAGASAREPSSLVELELASGRLRVLRRFSAFEVDADYLSLPEPIAFETTGGRTAHALFYPPRNRDFEAPPGEAPPLLTKCHGGPTAAASSALSLRTQYWTSRGIAVLDVNYGGSTGYGRAYRERLAGQWGVVDVDDCANGARALVARGRVDGERLAITGGSAGGYTTLCALTFRKVFEAGASHYGISDLEALARDTHKFESRYTDRLVAPYPERRDLYVERSPIHHVDRLTCPVIFFQGLEDRVVPPDQAQRMVEALRAKGLPVAYLAFEGEQHGFRRAENIRRALDAEFAFYARIFGFEPADPLPELEIENLPPRRSNAPRGSA
ncbi:MAG: S9 family peptidase [Deltaproteobacteria bacterium]|nr:MAG: S9 family peptidase [Deltaproteobacteria bacterium]